MFHQKDQARKTAAVTDTVSLSKQRAKASSLIGSLEPTMPTERTATAWLQLFDESPLFEDDQKLCYKKQVRRAAMQLDDVASPFAFEYLESDSLFIYIQPSGDASVRVQRQDG